MFSAYCLCRSTSGLQTVWQQQFRYFLLHQELHDLCPRAKWETDLVEAIRACLDAGDAVVLGINMNDDTCDNTLTTGLRSLGLQDAILSMHNPASPPATQNRNTSRTSISVMRGSPSVIVSRLVVFPFDSKFAMSSDHRLLWIEVDSVSILGKYLPTPTLKSRL